MRGECTEPNKEGCPYAERKGGCFSDEDHIYPRRLGKTALENLFIQINTQQICRWEHEKKSKKEAEELPSREIIKEAVAQAIMNGEIYISECKLEKIFGKEVPESLKCAAYGE
jgi:hypothetical protein